MSNNNFSINHCELKQRQENTEWVQGRNPGESELCHEQAFTILESFGECQIFNVKILTLNKISVRR